MKGVNFGKKLSTKKRSSEIFENRRGFFQKIFLMLSENIFSLNFCPLNICDPNFCPPNIYDKFTPVIPYQTDEFLFLLPPYHIDLSYR